MDGKQQPSNFSFLEILSVNLLKTTQQNNTAELNIVLHQLTEAVNIPGDLSCLIGPVVKLLPSHNIHIKKTVYSIIPRLCSVHPDTALLIANTVIHDTKDPNPIIKCLAITAIASVPPLHREHAFTALSEGLKDGNPRVRLSAVTGCGQIYKKTPDLIKEHGLIDRLYGCIRDTDPTVVTTCLIVLDTILAAEGGIVVNKSIAGYLLRRLKEFPDPQLATVLQVLRKYIPADDEELFHELSLLDPYLLYSTSAAVVVNCIQLFLNLTFAKYPQLKNEIIERVIPVLKEFMSTKSSKDSTNHVLDFLLVIVNSDPDWLKPFSDTLILFYPIDGADLAISVKQLQLLPHVCDETNYKELLKILNEKYCRHQQLSMYAINCIYQISKHQKMAQSECLKVFVSLLDCSSMQVSNNVLEIIQNFDLSNYEKNDLELLLNKIISKVNFSDASHDIPAVLPRLMGDFGVSNEKSPYVLETLAENFYSYDGGFRLLTLTCAVKLFLQAPAKYQHTLGEIFEKCIFNPNNSFDHDSTLDLNLKARKYYQLLKNDTFLIRKMLLFNNN